LKEVSAMWLKITPDMDLNMEVELQGIDENTRDYDVQVYEKVVRDALKERLKKVFAEEDINIYAVDAGIAREKYIRRKAA
jgi:SpoVK/Ycf46/Vps4 family AAA+-type ATPase